MRAFALTIACTLALGACAKVNQGEQELAAAEQAIADARVRAKDCMPESFTAAEALLGQAKAAVAKKDYKDAMAKANEASKLAKQAIAASPDGCDKKLKEALDPNLNKASATDAANRSADLSSIEQTIYFDYNDAALREDGKAILTKLASMLMKDPGLKVEIEGHCDDRGSTEYNLHLGDRRARAVEKYLLTQGVKAGQISTISYGEERPIDPNDNDAAWAKNRRAEIKKAS